MIDNERKMLLEKYMGMPEKELNKMLMEPESEYREGIFPLLVEAAKSRGFYSAKEEIVAKSITVKQESEQKMIEQPLSHLQKILFAIFPGIAFWYFLVAPTGWIQRKKDARRYFAISSICYGTIILIFLLSIVFFSNASVPQDLILVICIAFISVCGLLLDLFIQKRKETKVNTCSPNPHNQAGLEIFIRTAQLEQPPSLFYSIKQ